MRKKYYIYYWRDFANTFNLYWAYPGDIIPESWERITKKKAIELINAYKDNDYGASSILPASFRTMSDMCIDKNFVCIGYVWEPKDECVQLSGYKWVRK